MRLALQLYTVREDLKNDFRGTVEAVAAMGYQGVELTGNMGGMEPEQLAGFLKSLGLATAGMHVEAADILNPESAMYRYAAALQSPYLSISLAWNVDKDWDGAIDTVRRCARATRAAGMTFTYHNHAQEFQKIAGAYALDILYQRTDPHLVKCELDTFWIKRGGADPVSYIRQYRNRTPQIHLKDLDPADNSFTEVGQGVIDVPGVYEAALYVGAEWIIVEQDKWKRPAIESARMSIEYLKSRKLA